MKVALVTTGPAERSGIGDYARRLAPHLARHCELEVYLPDEQVAAGYLDLPVRPVSALGPRSAERILYQLGNERAHAFMVPLVQRLGGCVVQHDWVLFDLATAAFPALERGGLAGHVEAWKQGGLAQVRAYSHVRRAARLSRAGSTAPRVGAAWVEQDMSAPAAAPVDAPGLSAARFDLPFNRSIVRLGDAFFVHSKWMRDRILEERNAFTPIAFVPHGAHRHWAPGDRVGARTRLGVAGAAPLFVSFGAIQEHKRIEPLLRAFARARETRADLRLVLAGALATESLDVPGMLARLGLAQVVTITGYLEEPDVLDWIRAADLCIQLRGPSTGGTSGALALALACGRGVIASDLAEQRELPQGAVVSVAPDEREVERLAELLLSLADDPGARAAMEDAARCYVAETASWERVGELYADHLEHFPAHRTGRKSLIASAIEAADQRRAERAAEEASGPKAND